MAQFSDWEDALMCARFSEYAYLSANQISDIFRPTPWSLKFYGDANTETQAFLVYGQLQKVAVLVFRGSQELGDWVRNITRAGLKPIDSNNPNGPKVVTAFWESWQAVANPNLAASPPRPISKIKPDLANLISSWGGPTNVQKIYVTGHSLGGAVAVLGAFDLARSTLSDLADGKLVLYNFGSPAIGDQALVNAYTAQRPKIGGVRFVDRNDPVPTILEPNLGYYNIPDRVTVSSTRVDSAHAIANYIDRIRVDSGMVSQLELQITTADSTFAQTGDRVSVLFNQSNHGQILERSVEHSNPFDRGYVDTFRSPDQLNLAFLELRAAPYWMTLRKDEGTIAGDRWRFTHVTVKWAGTVLFDRAVDVTLSGSGGEWLARLGTSTGSRLRTLRRRSAGAPQLDEAFAVASAITQDALHLFAITDSGELRYMKTASAARGAIWEEEVHPTLLSADCLPRAVAAADGSRIDVFVRNNYGTIMQSTRRADGWSFPIAMADRSDSPVGVWSSAPGEMDAVIVVDGNIKHARYANGQWGTWQDISGSRAGCVLPGLTPTIARTADGSLVALARIFRKEIPADGTLCGASSLDGKTWADWVPFEEWLDGEMALGMTRPRAVIALSWPLPNDALLFNYFSPTAAEADRAAGGMPPGLDQPLIGGASLASIPKGSVVFPSGQIAAFVVRQSDGQVLYSVYTDPGTKYAGAFPEPVSGWSAWQLLPGLGPVVFPEQPPAPAAEPRREAGAESAPAPAS